MPFNRFLYSIVLIYCLFWGKTLHATHIVGGEMNYTCLGNDQYEITLTIFRDCFNGNPNAWFDDPASVGVFNADNELLQQILIPLMGNDTLNPVLDNPCLVIPPDVCVHTTTYRTIVELPPIIGGYQLAYQRCCRNRTIVNIIDPLASGATYGVTISERALLECNSNPKFKEWPPIYICANEPIFFDQSAIDADGDSIVYRLCTPLLGATPDIPQPQPPNNPPYEPINWVEPVYGVDNMLNGSPGGVPLRINRETGFLTGLPNTIGQFVVGICIEEYRDGELISTTRRDFQYNVGVCGKAVSAFFAPEIQCDSLTVSFNNQSLGANDYLWLFEGFENPDASSMESNPSYTFQDTGRFDVTLIAQPGTICADTSVKTVNLQPNSLRPDFSFDFLSCSDSLQIQVNDLSTDSLFDIVEWSWAVLPEEQTSSDQNPIFSLQRSGFHVIFLEVKSENGCTKRTEQVLEIDLIEEELPADTLVICAGDSIELNAEFDARYTYLWDLDSNGNSTNPNPVVSPLVTTTYFLTISDTTGFCQEEKEITIMVPEPVVLDLPPDTTSCEPAITLVAATNVESAINWSEQIDFNNIFSTEDTVEVTPFGQVIYYVNAVDTFGCSALDSIVIIGNGVNIDIDAPPLSCQGDSLSLTVENLDSSDTLSYVWTPANQILNGANTNQATVLLEDGGENIFVVNIENQFGCVLVDSLVVPVIDTSNQIQFLEEQQCGDFAVQFSSSSANASFYNWNFGDINDPIATGIGAEVRHIYSEEGIYEVTVSLPAEIGCQDTLRKTIMVGAPEIQLDFEWTFESCTDTALVRFNDLSVNNQSSFIDRLWIFSNSITSDEENPTIIINSGQEIEVTLIQTSNDGCVDTLKEVINFELIEVDLPDSVLVCNRVPIFLNPNADTSLQYTWSPIEGLDNPFLPNPQANPFVTTSYQVLISDSTNQCEIQRDIAVIVNPVIEYELANDTTICSKDFTLLASSNQSVTYAWFEGDVTNSPIGLDPEIVVFPDKESIYYLRLQDSLGCEIIDSVLINGNAIDVLVDNSQTICIGDTLELNVINLTDDALFYDWNPKETILNGADGPNPLINPSETTLYEVSIENEFGCFLDTSVLVNIFNFIPPLQIEAEPDTLINGGEVQLMATDEGRYTYQWEPRILLDADNISNPVGTIEETTTFSLVIRDQNGCINQSFIVITVIDPDCLEPFVFIPNGFTPNDDGLNDRLEVKGNFIEEMYLVIYNRWGEKVFETRSQSDGWDGTFKGKRLPPDVFAYYLELRCIGGQEYIKKGNITLIR